MIEPYTTWRIIGACFAILIIGPSFGFFHQYKEKKELENKGVWTKCIVIDEKQSIGKNKSWMIKCSYLANDTNFETSFKNDELNQYSIGDTLDIIYLEDLPKIYLLDYKWNE